MNPQKQMLQDRSFFNVRSLIYKTICWSIIITFSWQQIAYGLDLSYIAKPAISPQKQSLDKEQILDKVESLVDEGVDLSSLNQQEEKYITKRGYTAIEQIKQMRKEQVNLRRKQLLEYNRQYQTYLTEQTQKQTLFFSKYDSYLVYQDIMQGR